MLKTARLGVGIIGAGRVGPIIGAALAGAGHRLEGITSGADQDRVEAILPGVPMLSADEIARRSELVILAVPSDQLEDLVLGLAELGAWQAGQIVVHTDPGRGIGVLAPAARQGAIPLAIHPAMVFSGTSVDLRVLPTSYAAVTAPGPALPIAQALAVELGCEPVVVEEDARAMYAEAISTATTFSRSIVEQSVELLQRAGVATPGSYLSALVHSTVDQALAGAAPSIEPGDASGETA